MSGAAHRERLSYRLLFSAAVAGLMSVLIGGVLALVQAGPANALDAWLGTAPLAFAVAFPVSLFVVPFVQAWLDRLYA